MPAFHERLRELLGADAELAGVSVLFHNLQFGLRQQFPLQHVDLEDVEETLVEAAGKVAKLRERSKAAVPVLPALNPAPESIVPPAPEPDPKTAPASESAPAA